MPDKNATVSIECRRCRGTGTVPVECPVCTQELKKHPMQPIVKDARGEFRFKRNKIIDWLFNTGKLDLNEIASMNFPQEDEVQLAQLIGYSIVGFHELSYVPDSAALEASRIVEEQFGVKDVGCRTAGCALHCGVEEEA